jgi:hypothetical protein
MERTQIAGSKPAINTDIASGNHLEMLVSMSKQGRISHPEITWDSKLPEATSWLMEPL